MISFPLRSIEIIESTIDDRGYGAQRLFYSAHDTHGNQMRPPGRTAYAERCVFIGVFTPKAERRRRFLRARAGSQNSNTACSVKSGVARADGMVSGIEESEGRLSWSPSSRCTDRT